MRFFCSAFLEEPLSSYVTKFTDTSNVACYILKDNNAKCAFSKFEMKHAKFMNMECQYITSSL